MTLPWQRRGQESTPGVAAPQVRAAWPEGRSSLGSLRGSPAPRVGEGARLQLQCQIGSWFGEVSSSPDCLKFKSGRCPEPIGDRPERKASLLGQPWAASPDLDTNLGDCTATQSPSPTLRMPRLAPSPHAWVRGSAGLGVRGQPLSAVYCLLSGAA